MLSVEEWYMNTPEGKTRVMILTGHYRITGEINLLPGARLTDYIVDAKPFIALTDAEVSDRDGRRLLTAQFLNVQRDRIEVITPEELVCMGYKRSM
jgi:hypothetical protein